MKKIANKFFYRIDGQNQPIPGTLQRFNKKPDIGRWKEVEADICCPVEGCTPPCANLTWQTSIEKPVTVADAGFALTISINGVLVVDSSSEGTGEGTFNEAGSITLNAGDVVNVSLTPIGDLILGDGFSLYDNASSSLLDPETYEFEFIAECGTSPIEGLEDNTFVNFYLVTLETLLSVPEEEGE